jgi:hypothetical protein
MDLLPVGRSKAVTKKVITGSLRAATGAQASLSARNARSALRALKPEW